MAHISCGINELTNDSFANKSIRRLREELGNVLSIPEGATVLVNDEEVTDDNYVVRPTDEIEFVKTSGTKGA